MFIFLREVEKEMKKKIVSIFCCTLMLSTLFTIANARNIDEENESLIRGIQKINEDKVINSTILDIQYKNKVFCNSKDEYIDQQQTQHGSYGVNINYDQFVAQSFKPSVQRLSKVELKLFKYGGVPDYELELYVREELQGDDLVTVTKEGSEVINGWNEFDFPDLQVEIDQTYYLVCEGDGGLGGDPIYCWYYSDTNPYNRGMVHIFNYDIWHSVSGSDCCFKTIYTNDPPNLPSNPDPYDGETNVNINAILSWTCSDPDGDNLVYDVYFEADDSTPDILVSEGQTETTYDPETLFSKTTYYWQIIAEDNFGASTTSPVWQFRTSNGVESDLECTGDLTWTKVEPGTIVSKEIYVENIAASGSLLDWEIIEWPDWGNWAFTPIEGYDLRPEDGQVTVKVFVKAPDEGNEHFSGHVTVVNKENAGDFEILDVSLTTPRNKRYINTPFLNFLQQHPQMFPIIRHLLGE